MTDSLRGKLLVAAPMLVDPNFNRTVVLLLEHNDDGAIGLVLNRPSDVVLNDALSSWAELAPAPAVVFVGGPVSAESAIGLAEARSSTVETETDGFAPLLEGLGTVDLARPPDLVLPAVALHAPDLVRSQIPCEPVADPVDERPVAKVEHLGRRGISIKQHRRRCRDRLIALCQHGRRADYDKDQQLIGKDQQPIGQAVADGKICPAQPDLLMTTMKEYELSPGKTRAGHDRGGGHQRRADAIFPAAAARGNESVGFR